MFLCHFSAINPEEKIEIKQILLQQSFIEPIPQIAIQLAVLIGNIARLDYPNTWNEVSESNLSTVMTCHFDFLPFAANAKTK